MMQRTPTVLVSFLLVIAAACSSSEDGAKLQGLGSSSGGQASNAGGSGNNHGGGSAVASGGSGISVNPGAGSTAKSTGTGGLDPAAACVSSSATGQPVPVDLYFMVDITGSMNCPVPEATSTPCEVDPGPPYSSTTRWTVESAALVAFMSSPANSGLGVGIAFFPKSSDICNSQNYVIPSVEIDSLPAASQALNAAIRAQKPSGYTPTVPSLTGATQHASAWAKSHSGHRVAVVYATDGYPKGCTGTGYTIDAAADLARTAFSATPSIRTYVLGVGPNLSGLDQIARSGGTDHAYLVDTGADAAAELAAALGRIRTDASLGCAYSVPPPPAGQSLEYGKVNVRYTSSTGAPIDILRDPSEADCNQGWQYSADKKQINLCGTACESVKADAGGHVEILFGCETVVDIPR